MTIGVPSDERLQDGGSQLENQRDDPDLGERKSELFLDKRINGRNYRLDRIVEQMRETDGEQDEKCGRDILPGTNRNHSHNRLQRYG